MLSQEALGENYKNNFDSIYPELAKKYKVSFYRFC